MYQLVTWLAVFILFSAVSAGAEVPETAGLTIDVDELTDEPAFIDWIQDDIPMQLIALKDPDGMVRLAFNTCQTCNGSPWAWFEYLGNGELECWCSVWGRYRLCWVSDGSADA